MVSSTDAHFEAEDAQGQWIGERTEPNPNAFELGRDLYLDRKDWADSNGEFASDSSPTSSPVATSRSTTAAVSAGF